MGNLALPTVLGVIACVAITAIYFLWVRKLTPRAPEQKLPAEAPEVHS